MTGRLLLAVALLSAGCATFDEKRGHDEVGRLTKERLGVETGWEEGSPSAERIDRRVDALLDGGLDPERAVRLALINSPALQATYEELGISQAELVQAGRLSNPEVDMSIGFPAPPFDIHEREFGVVQSFVELLMLPSRYGVASDQFVADTLRVAHEALSVAAEAKVSLLEVRIAAALAKQQEALLETERLAADLARRQHEAGNITELEWAERTARYESARVELARTQLSLLSAREKFNRLTGLWGPRTAWTLRGPESELNPPAEPPSHERLEALAMERRLDLQAAKKQTLLFGRALELAHTFRWFGRIDVGIHHHKDANGPSLWGPTLTLELPLFDQRQGLIANLESEKRRAERQLYGLAVEARSQVRETQARLRAAHALVQHLETRVLPLRDRVVEQSLLQYNGMQIGLYELLEAKHAQLESTRDLLEAKQSYWSAAYELERLCGGTLPSSPPVTKK